MPSPLSAASHSQTLPQRPGGITAIVILHWSGAAVLAILALLLLIQGLFPTTNTAPHSTQSVTIAMLPLYGAWLLIYTGKGLWRMQPGPYVVAVFLYVLATLAQLAAIMQGYYWLSASAFATLSIFVYLLLPQIWWSFYPKAES
jgi:hypothetical protein